VADGLLAGLRRVGGDCRDRLSAGVRVHLITEGFLLKPRVISQRPDLLYPWARNW
jgi:hypothetical protein